MKVASNVKKRKVSVKAGPGDDKKKPASTSATADDRRTIYSVDNRADMHSKAHTLKVGKKLTDEYAKKAATGDYGQSAAPRVGGKVTASSYKYTGQGAAPGAKKLKKAPTKSVIIRRKKS